MAQRILVYVLVAAALGGGAYWYFMMGPGAPAEVAPLAEQSPPPNEGTPGTTTDPAAGGTSGGDSGAAGSSDTAGTGGADSGTAADDAADGTGDGSGLSALATKDASVQLRDGEAAGNNASAVELAGVVVAAGTQQSVALRAHAVTVPAAGPEKLDGQPFNKWRKSVKAASLQVAFADEAGTTEWNKEKQAIRKKLLDSWLKLLAERYPAATHSVTLASNTGALLASADRPAGGSATYAYS